jgi:uncharacterized membrane protein
VRRQLPLWAWLLPLGTAVGAVIVWTIWGDTERGTLIGGILIGLSAVLVYALALEELPHERGVSAVMRRNVIAIGLGIAAGVGTLLAAGIGYWFEYHPFG